MIKFTVNILLISLETLAKMLQLKKKKIASFIFFSLKKKNLAVPDSTVQRSEKNYSPWNVAI